MVSYPIRCYPISSYHANGNLILIQILSYGFVQVRLERCQGLLIEVIPSCFLCTMGMLLSFTWFLWTSQIVILFIKTVA
jgi:hypothetical protein